MQCFHNYGGIIRTFYAIFIDNKEPTFICENKHEVTYDIWKETPYIQDLVKKLKTSWETLV